MMDQLQEIIRRYSKDKDILIREDMALLTDLEFNSLELVEMVCDVEEEFDVEIPDRVIRDFKTVQDLLDYISARLS